MTERQPLEGDVPAFLRRSEQNDMPVKSRWPLFTRKVIPMASIARPSDARYPTPTGNEPQDQDVDGEARGEGPEKYAHRDRRPPLPRVTGQPMPVAAQTPMPPEQAVEEIDTTIADLAQKYREQRRDENNKMDVTFNGDTLKVTAAVSTQEQAKRLIAVLTALQPSLPLEGKAEKPNKVVTGE